MKHITFLKPIKRLPYFYGVIILFFIPRFFGFSAVSGLGDVSKMMSAFFFISLFFSIIKITWDYRRIIDISTNKLYLLLLIIPLSSITESVLLSKWGSVSLKYSVPELSTNHPLLFMMIGVIGMANFLYQIFLLFMKGKSKDAGVSS